jgi:hypothetical protein
MTVCSFGCKETSDRNSSNDRENIEKTDSTSLENQDNNGQPTSGKDGGKVTETEGAPEAGYGSTDGSETESAREATDK